jgi:pimeloyl-ACP methyl ester carboxylesterase
MSTADHQRRQLRPPSPWLLLLEARAPWEYAAAWAAMPWLKRGPRGDGHPVVVLPGFQASDLSTAPMRRFLRERGYTPYGWGLGTNRGPGGGVREACRDLVQRVADRHGVKVSLVGWSLGGVFAREIAKTLEAQIRCVITLGSPFSGHPRPTRATAAYERHNGPSRHDPERAAWLRTAPRVPTTSIYSRTDAIVDWRSSLNDDEVHTENIEVNASHIGMGVNPLVLYVIADRLRQDPAHWQRFDARAAHRLFFRGAQARQFREAQA